jgi:uncharacterized protein (TIGR02271 family)
METNSNMPMGSTVAGLFRDRESAEKAVQDLQAAGFALDQIEKLDSSGGTTEGTATMLDELVVMGLTQSDAQHFQGSLETGAVLLTLHVGNQATEALSILERYGADTGTMHLNPAATPSKGAQRLELLKEVLQVNKRRVQTGEVTLRKEVITEMQTVQVPVTREEMVITRRRVTNAEVAKGEIGTSEEIRVPLSEEQVTVEKLPVVSEEVIVGKRSVHQTEQVQETVRREELRTSEEIQVPLSEERVTVEKLPVVSEQVIVGKRSVHQTEQVQETVQPEQLRPELL